MAPQEFLDRKMTPQELRAWRKSIGLTQAQAAEIMGVSVRGYQNWEADDAEISDRVMAVAEYYTRRHRTRHGVQGRPLLYAVRQYQAEPRVLLDTFLVIARSGDEAAKLVHAAHSARAGVIAHLVPEAVADAPADAIPRVISTVDKLAGMLSLTP